MEEATLNCSPRVNIIGIGINAINLNEAVKKIAGSIEEGSRHYVNVCTVHTLMECHRDPALQTMINMSGLATPDGMPLVWLCHFHGQKRVTRVYGPDLMLEFCKYSVAPGYRHFFYGGAPGVAQQLARKLENKYPGIQVAGTHSPPLRKVGALEDHTVIEAINATRPDVVWVSLGTPKQDFWVAQHRPLLHAPVLVAVGAAFDFHTGRVRQAPVWMQRHGLEWLFRLMQEPRRLAYRYLIYNPLFLMHIVMQISGMRRYSIF